MKKAMGLVLMIATVMVGSMTVYAAQEDWNGPASVCTHNAACTVHENCQDREDCEDAECPYGGDHCQYRDSGSRSRHHGGKGHGHGRSHC